MADPYYITTAIFYPNGEPHMGSAYEVVCTDAIARYQRLAGRDVFFMTGTDEHGLKIAQKARDLEVTPRELTDRMSARFRDLDDILNISYDRYIRTVEAAHHAASQALWQAMEARGDLYLGRYEGWYSVRDEAFYDDAELVEGEGGARLSPQRTAVEWTVEESWFFRLSAYQDRLLALYEAQPDWLQPRSRFNEVISFVKGGLRDLSISRNSFDWGVKVPGNPEHVMYVWVDALTNYLTGLGYPDTESEAYKRFWPCDLHVIGKDIVRFHAVYWPAFLMSAGLPLPKKIFGHGFLLKRGEKMSKSIGNVDDPFAMAEQYGVDQLRYFLLREVSFGQDGSYSDEAIANRINADLANGLGNLAQRSLSMIAKNCGGTVPTGSPAVAERLGEAPIAAVHEAMAELAPHKALEAAWSFVAEANKYFADEAPWAVRKTDPERADAILYETLEMVRRIAILVRWAMPASADRLLDQLGQGADARDFAALAVPLEPGLNLPPPQGVFPRIVQEA